MEGLPCNASEPDLCFEGGIIYRRPFETVDHFAGKARKSWGTIALRRGSSPSNKGCRTGVCSLFPQARGFIRQAQKCTPRVGVLSPLLDVELWTEIMLFPVENESGVNAVSGSAWSISTRFLFRKCVIRAGPVNPIPCLS